MRNIKVVGPTFVLFNQFNICSRLHKIDSQQELFKVH